MLAEQMSVGASIAGGLVIALALAVLHLMAPRIRRLPGVPERALGKAGWSVVRVSGSHEIWEHPAGRSVVIPGGGKDNREVPTGTLASIRRDTGLSDLR